MIRAVLVCAVVACSSACGGSLEPAAEGDAGPDGSARGDGSIGGGAGDGGSAGDGGVAITDAGDGSVSTANDSGRADAGDAPDANASSCGTSCGGCCQGAICAVGNQDFACGSGGGACVNCRTRGAACSGGACR